MPLHLVGREITETDTPMGREGAPLAEEQTDRRTTWSKEFIFTIAVFLLSGIGQYFALSTRVATSDVQSATIKASVDKIESNTNAIRDKVDQLGNTVGQQAVKQEAQAQAQAQERTERINQADQMKAWIDGLKDRVSRLEATSGRR